MVLAIVAIPNTISSQANVSKATVPNWVNLISYSAESDTINNNHSYHYLLEDRQYKLDPTAFFVHDVIKINNSEGVQNMSKVELDFDPSYQRILFHYVRVIRNGKLIDQLDLNKLSVIQREKSHEEALYDGRKTAILNLSDVRVGDVVEYAYTKSGANPILNGHFYSLFYQRFRVPNARFYQRLVTKTSKKLYLKTFNEAEAPAIESDKGIKEYVWDIKDAGTYEIENNTPSWFFNQPFVEISTYESWQDVIDWARPLYSFNRNGLSSILNAVKKFDKLEDKVMYCIRFVQDEIRYLGFENGINAYKPHPSGQVLKQRFGDCKDKSLLLSTLLQSLGVKSSPMLVDTYDGSVLNTELPAHTAFDHCVVYFEYDGKNRYVDPTISNQGGSINNLQFPEYSYGLILDNEHTGLVELENDTESKLEIQEVIKFDSIGGKTNYTIESKYFGNKADSQRSYFSQNSLSDVQSSYMDFYSSMYPTIKSRSDIEIIDTSRNSDNEITVIERYVVDNIWEMDEDSITSVMYVSPIVLSSMLEFPASSERTMPYYLGEPYKFYQSTTIELPEAWDVADEELSIENDLFDYNSTVRYTPNRIHLANRFELHNSFVNAQDYQEFKNEIERVNDDLNFGITYNRDAANPNLSFLSIFIFLIGFILGGLICWYLDRNFNPKPKEGAKGLGIGGWLVLPALGLCLSPFMMVYYLIDAQFFSTSIWVGLRSSGVAMNLIVVVEFIYNSIFTVFTLYLMYLLFNRRTSFPRLIIIFYLLSALIPLLDYLAIVNLVPEYATDDENAVSELSEIVKSFFTLFIWGTYFYVSKRVADTFVNQREPELS